MGTSQQESVPALNVAPATVGSHLCKARPAKPCRGFDCVIHQLWLRASQCGRASVSGHPPARVPCRCRAWPSDSGRELLDRHRQIQWATALMYPLASFCLATISPMPSGTVETLAATGLVDVPVAHCDLAHLERLVRASDRGDLSPLCSQAATGNRD